jgi:hypothetical protein
MNNLLRRLREIAEAHGSTVEEMMGSDESAAAVDRASAPCGARHPRRPKTQCTLPLGHYEVEMPGVPFSMTHADLTDPEQPLVWREN